MTVLRILVSSVVVAGSATAPVALSIIPAVVLIVIVPVTIIRSIGIVVRVVCIPITVVTAVRLGPIIVIARSPVSRR